MAQREQQRDDVKLAPAMEEPAKKTESASREKFAAGGAKPEVAPTTANPKPPQPTASQMAFDESSSVREMKTKVSDLVKRNFGGNYEAAFRSYDDSKGGTLNRGELTRLLEDAGVGSLISRSTAVQNIIKQVDSSQDGEIGWMEFKSAMNAKG